MDHQEGSAPCIPTILAVAAAKDSFVVAALLVIAWSVMRLWVLLSSDLANAWHATVGE